MAFIFISEYFGMYTAIVTIPKYETPPIDNLEQLWKSKDLKWISDWPSNTKFYIDYFRKSAIDIKDRLYIPNEIIDDDPHVAALKHVKESNGQIVYFETEVNAKAVIDAHSLEANSEVKYYFSKEKFSPSFSVLYYATPCYYSEYLNRAILVMQDMYIDGLAGRDYDRTNFIRARLKETPPPTDYGLIQLKHLITAAKIIGGVCSLSHISLVVEIIYNYVKEKLANEN